MARQKVRLDGRQESGLILCERDFTGMQQGIREYFAACFLFFFWTSLLGGLRLTQHGVINLSLTDPDPGSWETAAADARQSL